MAMQFETIFISLCLHKYEDMGTEYQLFVTSPKEVMILPHLFVCQRDFCKKIPYQFLLLPFWLTSLKFINSA